MNEVFNTQEFCDAVNAATAAQKALAIFEEKHKKSLSFANQALLETVFSLNKLSFETLFKVGRA